MNHLDEITLSHNRLRFSMSMGIYAFNTSLTFDEAFKGCSKGSCSGRL